MRVEHVMFAAFSLATSSIPNGAASGASDCRADLSVFSIEEGLELGAPEQFAYRTALFFKRVTVTMIDMELGGTLPGMAMRADGLFTGRDTRWRLTRPVPLINDPDAIVIDPPQTQYIIQPMHNAAYNALILVGIPESGVVERPALAGQLAAPDGRIFTIEPVDPASCQIAPNAAAGWADAIIERNPK